MLVHTLEHGRIDLQYRPGTPAATVARLERLVDELEGGYHMLLFQNETEMPFAVAATAWGHLLGCPEMNDQRVRRAARVSLQLHRQGARGRPLAHRALAAARCPGASPTSSERALAQRLGAIYAEVMQTRPDIVTVVVRAAGVWLHRR